MIGDVRVGDFFCEKVKSVSLKDFGMVLEVNRDPEAPNDGYIKVLMNDGHTEGGSYRGFLQFYNVYR